MLKDTHSNLHLPPNINLLLKGDLELTGERFINDCYYFNYNYIYTYI